MTIPIIGTVKELETGGKTKAVQLLELMNYPSVFVKKNLSLSVSLSVKKVLKLT